MRLSRITALLSLVALLCLILPVGAAVAAPAPCSSQNGGTTSIPAEDCEESRDQNGPCAQVQNGTVTQLPREDCADFNPGPLTPREKPVVEGCTTGFAEDGITVQACPEGMPDCSQHNVGERCLSTTAQMEEDKKDECGLEDGGTFDFIKKGIVSFACMFQKATVNMMQVMVESWASQESVKPEDNNTVSPFIRGALMPFAILIALAGVIWQGIVIMISRRAEPLIDVIRGFFMLSLWIGIGLAAPSAALALSDGAAEYILRFWEANDSNSGLEWATDIALARAIGDPIEMIMFSIVAIFAAIVQNLIMIWREAMVLILAGASVLAAAGSFTQGTRQWLPRLVSWMVALIAYKPIAALMFAAAGRMYQIGTTGWREYLMGLMLLWMSIFALPVLMKTLTWATGSVGGSGIQAATGAAQTYALYGRNR